jgi:hypothetical protein
MSSYLRLRGRRIAEFEEFEEFEGSRRSGEFTEIVRLTRRVSTSAALVVGYAVLVKTVGCP